MITFWSRAIAYGWVILFNLSILFYENDNKITVVKTHTGISNFIADTSFLVAFFADINPRVKWLW